MAFYLSIKFFEILIATFIFMKGIFYLGGINPNLPLIVFTTFFTRQYLKNKFLIFLILCFFFLIFVYIYGGIFFIKEFIFYTALLFVLFILEKKLGGHWYLDGFLLIAIFNILFHIGISLFFNSTFLVYKLIGNILYDYLLFVLYNLLVSKKI